MRQTLRFAPVFLALLSTLFLTRSYSVSAQDIRIEEPLIKVSSESDEVGGGGKVNLRLLVGEAAEREFLLKGAIAQAGLPTLSQYDAPFQFSIDKDQVTDHQTRLKGDVALDTPSQYRVYVGISHLLQDTEGQSVSVTRCDLSNPCTPSHATSWKDSNIFGLGYTVGGDDVQQDFRAEGYRPYTEVEKNSVLDKIVESNYLAEDRRFEVKNKLNLKTSDRNKRYQTTIIILATPGY